MYTSIIPDHPNGYRHEPQAHFVTDINLTQYVIKTGAYERWKTK